MRVYYGYENIEIPQGQRTDQQEDFFITPIAVDGSGDCIRLLHINPIRTTTIFEDFGFISDSQKNYVYLDMICAFFILYSDDREKEMFLLQVEEELVAVVEDQKIIYVLGEHHQPLVKKWASSYNIGIEFILF